MPQPSHASYLVVCRLQPPGLEGAAHSLSQLEGTAHRKLQKALSATRSVPRVLLSPIL